MKVMSVLFQLRVRNAFLGASPAPPLAIPDANQPACTQAAFGLTARYARTFLLGALPTLRVVCTFPASSRNNPTTPVPILRSPFGLNRTRSPALSPFRLESMPD